MTNLSPARPAALASAAAAVLHGANPLTVSDIPFDHPALPAAVRDLAAATGEPVPAMYADRDTIADLIGIDPREADISAADADEHHAWAREHGLADDADEHPSDYADGEPVEDAYPHDWDDGSLDWLAGPE